MDKLLNLIAAIDEENFEYQKDIFVPASGDRDFIITCVHLHDKDVRNAFSFDYVLEALQDFSDYDITVYSRDETPEIYSEKDSGIRAHVVEIEVIR